MSSSSQTPILEGILAINKPQALTSADVLRDLQTHFTPSPLFAPHLASIRAARAAEPPSKARYRRDRRPLLVKMGHGGTLDPLATGVLIAGIGSGTKSLARYLSCTKSYEAVVVFGAESDTYDVLGRVVATAGTEGVTAERVERALDEFRGTIMQRPPVYSARRINGERLYDMARQGKEIPDGALKEREVEVSELEMVEFWNEGDHGFVMKTEERSPFGIKKRKHSRYEGEESLADAPPTKAAKIQSMEVTIDAASASDPVMSGALPVPDDNLPPSKGAEGQHGDGKEAAQNEAKEQVAKHPSLGPAARIRMTVTSGFYVRSLCHDLGKALDSAGVMAELARTRQGEFELGRNVLEYDDLEKGEDVWGPKVKAFLEDWQTRASKGDVPEASPANA